MTKPEETIYNCMIEGRSNGTLPACKFQGTWAESLEHATTHQLPHPDQREEWLTVRRTFIGASEIGALAGLQFPYQTALDVYLSKTSPEPNDKTSGRARMGQVLEGALLDDFAVRYGCELVRPATRRHPNFPFIAATPDSLVVGGNEGVQVKVVGGRMAHHWNDGPPKSVIAQVQTEMAVFDLSQITVLAMIDSDEPQEFVMKREPEMFQALADLAGVFWKNHIVPRVLPVDFDKILTLKAVARAFPSALLPLAQATEDEQSLARAYYEASAQEKVAREARDAAQAALEAAIGEREGFAWGSSRVTWKPPKGSPMWKEIVADLKKYVTDDIYGDTVAHHTPEFGTRRICVAVKD